jgi:hypothetical protein
MVRLAPEVRRDSKYLAIERTGNLVLVAQGQASRWCSSSTVAVAVCRQPPSGIFPVNSENYEFDAGQSGTRTDGSELLFTGGFAGTRGASDSRSRLHCWRVSATEGRIIVTSAAFCSAILLKPSPTHSKELRLLYSPWLSICPCWPRRAQWSRASLCCPAQRKPGSYRPR